MSLVIGAACLWGTVGIAGQYLYSGSDISPITVGFYRLVVASAVISSVGLIFVARERMVLPKGTRARIVLIGMGLGFYQVCYFAAVQAVGVSVATLITLGLAPVLVTVGAGFLFGEKAGGRVVSALAMALAGLMLLFWDPSGVGLRSGVLLGATFATGSAIGYAGVTLVSRSISNLVDPFGITLYSFAIGTVILLPPAAIFGLSFDASTATVVPLLYLGIVPTVVAYGLFFAGLQTVRSSVASILTLIEPLTATVLAALLFSERLGAAGTVGGALLLCAVVLLYSGRSRK